MFHKKTYTLFELLEKNNVQDGEMCQFKQFFPNAISFDCYLLIGDDRCVDLEICPTDIVRRKTDARTYFTANNMCSYVWLENDLFDVEFHVYYND